MVTIALPVVTIALPVVTMALPMVTMALAQKTPFFAHRPVVQGDAHLSHWSLPVRWGFVVSPGLLFA
jgi:hypothetical protein